MKQQGEKKKLRGAPETNLVRRISRRQWGAKSGPVQRERREVVNQRGGKTLNLSVLPKVI